MFHAGASLLYAVYMRVRATKQERVEAEVNKLKKFNRNRVNMLKMMFFLHWRHLPSSSFPISYFGAVSRVCVGGRYAPPNMRQQCEAL